MSKRLILLLFLLGSGIGLISYGIYSFRSTGYFVYEKETMKTEVQEEFIQSKNATPKTETVTETLFEEPPPNKTIELKCPDSCDDNNPCTSEGCSKETNYTCNYIVIIPCCGNEICESSESCSSCNTDCGNCPIQTSQQPIVNEPQTQPSTKTLVMVITVSNDPIVRGNNQTITIQVTDRTNAIENSFVNLTVYYFNSSTTKNSFGYTNSSGIFLYSWRIGGNSKPGTFTINATATKEGFVSTTGVKTFEVIPAT